MAQIDKNQFVENFQYFDKEIVLENIDIFINEYPDRIKVIEESISAKNFDDIKFHSHSIKGVIANFCATDAEQQARDLELKGNEKDSSGIEQLFEAFKETSSQLVDELKEMRQQYL